MEESVSWSKSLRFRLTAVVVLVSLFWGIAVMLSVFHVYNKRIEAEYAKNAVSISKMVASALKWELVDHYAQTLETDEEYNRILHIIRDLLNETGAAYIYVSKPVPEGEIFIFDTDEKEHYDLGKIEAWSKDNHDRGIPDKMLRGERVEPIVSTNKWGWLLKTREPVLRADGSVAAYVCVDMSLDKLLRERKKAFVLMGIIIAVILFVSLTVNLYTIRRFVLSPMRRLVKGVYAYHPGMALSDLFVRSKLNPSYEFKVLERAITDMDFRIRGMLDKIEQQNNLLQTVNKVSEIMLQSHIDVFESDLKHSMSIMAKATGSDRVYIWKNYTKNGQLYCHQIYEWSEGAESQKDFELAVETRYSDIVPEWEELLPQGCCINGIVREMSENEQAALSPQGILSILVVPIFLKKQFWGFVGFDDCHKERIFSEKEEMILRSASQLIANALIRNEEEEKTRQAEEHIRLMFDATPLSCQLWDKDFNFINCNKAALLLYGFKCKEEYIGRFSEISPEYQPDGQHSKEKANIYIKKAFDEGLCVFDWMHQTLDGKPIPAEVTLVRVKYKDDYIVASYVRDLRIIKSLEEKAEQVYYDALTGIYNRRYLDESLSRLIKTLSRSSGTLSLMMIDIDWFKRYNDTYGHREGDSCLKMVSEIISKTLSRDSDFVARYGGEEFTIVLPNTDRAGACIIAEKLLENIRNAKIPHSKSDIAEHVTISIGVTTGKASHTQNGNDYIKKADEMLYKSKQGGRNRFYFAALKDVT